MPTSGSSSRGQRRGKRGARQANQNGYTGEGGGREPKRDWNETPVVGPLPTPAQKAENKPGDYTQQEPPPSDTDLPARRKAAHDPAEDAARLKELLEEIKRKEAAQEAAKTPPTKESEG